MSEIEITDKNLVDTYNGYITELNGNTQFNTYTDAIGFIKSDEKMYLTKAEIKNFQLTNNEEDKKKFDKKYEKDFILSNASKLIKSGMDAKAAICCSAMRYQLCCSGFLTNDMLKSMANEIHISDENVFKVTKVKGKLKLVSCISIEEIRKMFSEFKNRDQITIFKRASLPVAMCMAVMFYRRGHHFQNDTEFTQTLQRLFKSAVRDEKIHEYVSVCPEYFRTAIHPFGLLEFLKYVKESKNVPKAFKIRITGACAGTGAIFVARDIIYELESFNLLKYFVRWHPYQLSSIISTYETIKSNTIKYHVLGEFLTGKALSKEEKESLEKGMASVREIAPLLQAFIKTFLARTPFSKAKSLVFMAKEKISIYKAFVIVFRKMYKNFMKKANMSDTMFKTFGKEIKLSDSVEEEAAVIKVIKMISPTIMTKVEKERIEMARLTKELNDIIAKIKQINVLKVSVKGKERVELLQKLVELEVKSNEIVDRIESFENDYEFSNDIKRTMKIKFDTKIQIDESDEDSEDDEF